MANHAKQISDLTAKNAELEHQLAQAKAGLEQSQGAIKVLAERVTHAEGMLLAIRKLVTA